MNRRTPYALATSIALGAVLILGVLAWSLQLQGIILALLLFGAAGSFLVALGSFIKIFRHDRSAQTWQGALVDGLALLMEFVLVVVP